jgi:hypothetical protein
VALSFLFPVAGGLHRLSSSRVRNRSYAGWRSGLDAGIDHLNSTRDRYYHCPRRHPLRLREKKNALLVTTFYCTKCDFEQGDAGTLGSKEYLLPNGVRLPVDWQLGWCNDCGGLSAVEELSEEERRKSVEKAEQELAKHPPRPVRHWWQLHWFLLNVVWQQRLGEGERNHLDLVAKLDVARDALSFLGQRKSPARCLACGSIHVVAPLVRNHEPWEDPERPKATGFTHPGCGGELWMREDGLRIGLRPSVRRYTPEGDFLDQEYLDGYTLPQSEFYLERNILNAKARGKTIPAAVTKPDFFEVLREYAK